MQEDGNQSELRATVAALAIGWLLLAPGCTSKSAPNLKASETGPARTNSPLERQFDGGSYCVQTFTQGPAPAQPLHFSNKETHSDGSSKDFEADFSGDSFDLTFSERHPANDVDRELNKDLAKTGTPVPIRDGFAESKQTTHYPRSDESLWRIGPNSVAQAGTPWGLFIFKPAVTRVGTEQVNGYDTIKYAIDTTHESSMEKASEFLRQVKDYNITGTAWVLKDVNCILQYQIDDEQIDNHDKTNKTHYEGTVTKK